MLPCLAVNNSMNSDSCNTVFVGKFGLAGMLNFQSDRSHIGLRQFGETVLLATGQTFWVEARAIAVTVRHLFRVKSCATVIAAGQFLRVGIGTCAFAMRYAFGVSLINSTALLRTIT